MSFYGKINESVIKESATKFVSRIIFSSDNVKTIIDESTDILNEAEKVFYSIRDKELFKGRPYCIKIDREEKWAVDNDTKTIVCPYFKLYNTPDPKRKTFPVARIMLTRPQLIYHDRTDEDASKRIKITSTLCECLNECMETEFERNGVKRKGFDIIKDAFVEIYDNYTFKDNITKAPDYTKLLTDKSFISGGIKLC